VIVFSDLFDVLGDGPGTLVGEHRSHASTFMAELLPEPVLPVARTGGGSVLYLTYGARRRVRSGRTCTAVPSGREATSKTAEVS
jgi:hypothetical protein